MKTIKTTFIDTAGHGYLSVSKKDLINIGYPYEKISGFSGHNLTRVFLEEDCDVSDFIRFCEDRNISYEVKKTYNSKFKITHNYDSSCFNSKLKEGEIYKLVNDEICNILINNGKKIIVSTLTGANYKIPKTNPFQYIEEHIK